MERFVWTLTLGATCAAFGCSDPVPAAAAAGVNATIGLCATADFSRVRLGNPPPDRTRPASQGPATGTPIFSGEQGMDISCRVSGSGTYSISAKLRGALTFEVEGTISDTDGRGTARIGLSTTGTSEYVAQDGCTLQAVQTTRGFEVGPGAVWAHFFCSNLTAPPTVTCNATGEFLLERCRE